MKNTKEYCGRDKKKTKLKYLFAAKRRHNWYFLKNRQEVLKQGKPRETKNVTEQIKATLFLLLCAQKNHGYHTIAIYLKKDLDEPNL